MIAGSRPKSASWSTENIQAVQDVPVRSSSASTSSSSACCAAVALAGGFGARLTCTWSSDATGKAAARRCPWNENTLAATTSSCPATEPYVIPVDDRDAAGALHVAL